MIEYKTKIITKDKQINAVEDGDRGGDPLPNTMPKKLLSSPLGLLLPPLVVGVVVAELPENPR